jgi:hypothetical protein
MKPWQQSLHATEALACTSTCETLATSVCDRLIERNLLGRVNRLLMHPLAGNQNHRVPF